MGQVYFFAEKNESKCYRRRCSTVKGDLPRGVTKRLKTLIKLVTFRDAGASVRQGAEI